jgi:hypothetical protein
MDQYSSLCFVLTQISKKYLTKCKLSRITHVNIRKTLRCRPFRHGRNRKNSAFLKEVIKFFIQRDDNSRITSGKKETKCKGGQKEQVRFLNCSMQHLFEKFIAENPEISVSRSFFYRQRLFFVVFPKLNDRETCLCIVCCNMQV